jgi:hypothetical protein
MFLRKNNNAKNDMLVLKLLRKTMLILMILNLISKFWHPVKIKWFRLKDLFYQDEWLSGFGLDDVRMIAKAVRAS